MKLSSMSLGELVAEYLETRDEFIVPFARLKFGKETWRDALSNAAAQHVTQADLRPAQSDEPQKPDGAQAA